jgi:ribosome-associated protein
LTFAGKGISMTEIITIDTDFIKLDSLLKLAGVVMSGGEAKEMIQDGMIEINDVVEKRRGRKLYPGDRIVLDGAPTFVIERE